MADQREKININTYQPPWKQIIINKVLYKDQEIGSIVSLCMINRIMYSSRVDIMRGMMRVLIWWLWMRGVWECLISWWRGSSYK